MNVLVVCVPGAGHVNPLKPLVQALMAAGDEVVVAAGADAAPLVEGMGAGFFPAGHGESAWFERLNAHIRGVPGDGLAPERINHYFLPRLFGEVAAADMIDDVLDCGGQIGADLVLFETYALAGPLAADVLGVPAVHHLLGPLLEPEILELANDAVSPLWRSFGRSAPGYGGVYRDLTIEICPPSLEPLRVPAGARLIMRPTPIPVPGAAKGPRPLVYVTLGTFFNANVDIFRAVVDGLAGEAVDAVVTVGADQDPATLGAVAPNVRVERFVPQADLLPTCSAAVHHGGAGTMFGTLAQGIPHVVIPQGADNFVNADMLERAGVASVLRPGEVTPQGVRGALASVLGASSFETAARRIADEVAAMPSPGAVADALRARYAGATTKRSSIASS